MEMFIQVIIIYRQQADKERIASLEAKIITLENI
tara:strand:+ start:184 stop:285 length:102 start_codon:yes stop_codon:yes gene_type:complete